MPAEFSLPADSPLLRYDERDQHTIEQSKLAKSTKDELVDKAKKTAAAAADGLKSGLKDKAREMAVEKAEAFFDPIEAGLLLPAAGSWVQLLRATQAYKTIWPVDLLIYSYGFLAVGYAAGIKMKPDDDDRHGRGDYTLYLVNTSRSSNVTGTFRKEAEGLGLGSHFELVFNIGGGFGVGGKTDWQQTNLDSNDWVSVNNFFWKAEPLMLTWDVADSLYLLTDVSFFREIVIEGRAGPSFFSDWILSTGHQGDNLVNSADSNTVLMRSFGWEASGRVSVNLFILNIEGQFEYGSYPSLTYPKADPENYLFVRMVDYDGLRGQKSYQWYHYKFLVDIPIPWLFGKTWSKGSSLSGGYEIIRLEGSEGEGLNNQGFSISANFGW